MSMNRVQYLIRNILQNSKFNREKFVKNRKIYNEMVSKNKNFNLINKRNYGTYFTNSQFNNNNKNNKNNNLLYLILALSSYHITKRIIEN